MDDQLRALSRNKAQTEQSPVGETSRTSRWRTILLKGFPWLVAAAAVVVFLLLFGDRFLPAQTVTVESVVTLRTELSGPSTGSPGAAGDPFAGEVLFQASGWFEADPFPYRATALASGVVETVHVLEGQRVAAGDPIATMIREDAELRLKRAESTLEAARASLLATESEYDLAHARIESMRRQIGVAKARREELRDLADRAVELGAQVLAEQDIIQAGLRLETQDETIAALGAQLREREIEMERLAGQVKVRRGEVAAAGVRVREARLEFDRMVIRSPVDGIVQRLMVAPGQKKVLMADNPESATVALLFQPENMQARIDVPIAEASRLSPGQAVLVESEFLPGTGLRGHIQRIVGEADLQRNTLQVKVRIDDPPPGLRPEILCRAAFLDRRVAGGPALAGPAMPPQAPSGSASGLVVMVPRPALVGRDGNSAVIWAVDQSGRRVERREVVLDGPERDGYIAVRDGLRPGDRVVVNPIPGLRDNTRIQF